MDPHDAEKGQHLAGGITHAGFGLYCISLQKRQSSEDNLRNSFLRRLVRKKTEKTHIRCPINSMGAQLRVPPIPLNTIVL